MCTNAGSNLNMTHWTHSKTNQICHPSGSGENFEKIGVHAVCLQTVLNIDMIITWLPPPPCFGYGIFQAYSINQSSSSFAGSNMGWAQWDFAARWIQRESVILSAALGSVFTRILGQPDNEREAIQSSRRAKFPDRKWLSEVVITEDAAIPSLIKWRPRGFRQILFNHCESWQSHKQSSLTCDWLRPAAKGTL